MLEAHLEGLLGRWRDPRGSVYELSQESHDTLSVHVAHPNASSRASDDLISLECRDSIPRIYFGTSFILDEVSLDAQIHKSIWPPTSIIWRSLSGVGASSSWTRVSNDVSSIAVSNTASSMDLDTSGHSDSRRCSGILLDTSGPLACIVVVQRDHIVEHLLCVKCEESAGAGVFQFATTNAINIVGSESFLAELDDDDSELKVALAEKGECWQGCFMLVGATDGNCAGLRAVGVGSNVKKRRRAAHVALAATALAGNMLMEGKDGHCEDDALPDVMEDLARAALRAQIELSTQRSTM